MLERVPLRLHASLSDLGGYDPTIYGGTLAGLFRALTEAFTVKDAPFTEPRDLMRIYKRVRLVRGTIPADVFRKGPFSQLVLAAGLAVDELQAARKKSEG